MGAVGMFFQFSINIRVSFAKCIINLLFADDTKIFQYVNDTVDVSILQCTVDKFIESTDKWLVKLNVSRCKIMSVCHR